MTKIVKVLLIILMFGLFVVSFSYATDINMNLQASSVTSTENNISANTVSNSYSNQLITNSQNSVDYSSTITDTESTRVTTASSTQNETLGFTNILNILLIVVGVVLILLGIAILIRMHS